MNLKISDRFSISEFRKSDQSALVEQLNEKQIHDQTLNIPHPYSDDDAKWWLEHVQKQKEKLGRSINWAIRDGDKLIGGIGFADVNPGKSHRAEIGYWMAKPYWNQGVMTEAVKKITEFCFEELKLVRVTANVFAFNIGSARVLQKAGYRLEGYLPSHYKKNGEIFDGILYAKTLEDSKPSRERNHPFIKHYVDIQGKDDSRYPGSKELLSIGSPFGKSFDFKKLGIHHELLPPGRRTSYPHAESAEEEFIYVIEGTPDVWIDGHLYPLKPGDGVGFPSGTGTCHTFINNFKTAARLLVVGEKTKPENKIYYPLNPERKEQCKDFWWDDVPKKELGPHSGRPDVH